MTTRLIQSRQGLGSLPIHCLLIDKSSLVGRSQGRSSHACALAGVQSDSGPDALAAWNRRDLGTRRTSINPRASVVFEGGRRHLLAFLANWVFPQTPRPFTPIIMADKEAFVYIVDVGSTTSNCNNGRTESDLDFSMRYVWDKIATTAQASRKTWNVGVVGLRTDETRNDYQDGDGYNNISVLKELGPVALAQIKELTHLINPSNTEFGDAMSAIIVAAEMIGKLTKKLKYTRRIYLITDGQGPIDGDDVEQISSRLNELEIELVVLGVDFDDPEYGFKEEDKPQLKATNETILKSLVDKCNNGIFGTLAEAVQELDTPRVKPVRLVKSYDGPLTLGNPEQFASALSINVERWPVTKVNRPAAATTVTVKSESDTTQSTHTLEDEMDGVEYDDPQFNSVKQHRTYKINDPSAPGGKRDVEFEELNRGWAYGSTAVYIPDFDKSLTSLEAVKNFSIMGFVNMNKVRRIRWPSYSFHC